MKYFKLALLIVGFTSFANSSLYALSDLAVNTLSVGAAGVGAGVGYFSAFATKKFAHNAQSLKNIHMDRFVDNHPTAFNNGLWAAAGAAVTGVAARLLLHQFTPSARYSKAKKIYQTYSTLTFVQRKLSHNEEYNAQVYADAGYVSKPGQSHLIQVHVDLGHAGQDLQYAHELLIKAQQDATGTLRKDIEGLIAKINQAKTFVMYNIGHIERDPHYGHAYRIYLAERNTLSNEKYADAHMIHAKINVSREVRGWLDFLSRFNIRRFFDNLLAPLRVLIN